VRDVVIYSVEANGMPAPPEKRREIKDRLTRWVSERMSDQIIELIKSEGSSLFSMGGAG
jgi:hypothetical protein